MTGPLEGLLANDAGRSIGRVYAIGPAIMLHERRGPYGAISHLGRR